MKMRDIINILNEDFSTAVKSLTAIRSKSFSSRTQIEPYMVSLGFAAIGAGGWGTVFSHPRLDYVIKVYERDSAYSAFVEYVLNNPNRYLPQFRGRIAQLNDYIYAVRLERLSKVSAALYERPHGLMEIIVACQKSDKKNVGSHDQLYPGLTDVLLQLKNLAAEKDYDFDMHIDNVMLRGNTPVITDPFSNEY